MVVCALTKKKMAELISGYKCYAKDIIESRGCSFNNYKLIAARVESLSAHVAAGGCYPHRGSEAVTCWQRIPSLDFDKDSHVYLYCSDYNSSGIYRSVIINSITNEEKSNLVIVGYDYIGG